MIARSLLGVLSIIAVLIFSVAGGPPVVTTINPENAEDLLPYKVMNNLCAKLGHGPSECKPEDFFGTAVDLNGNGQAEFSLTNMKFETGNTDCTLYGDRNAKFEHIQGDFPCKIEPKESRTNGWHDIEGVIYPTECEPLKCEYTWDGSRYKQGACGPAEGNGGCVVP